MSMSDIQEAAHTDLDIITVVEEAKPVVIQDEKFNYPPLTQDEETFALAVVESSGNIAAAYRMTYGQEVQFPLSRGKQLLCKPAIALKIREITEVIQDASLISVGAHLHELAEIRDLAKATGQLKTALAAERNRGEAVGIYQKHDAKNKSGSTQAVQVNINMASKHDVNI
jgi:hypothetical protein